MLKASYKVLDDQAKLYKEVWALGLFKFNSHALDMDPIPRIDHTVQHHLLGFFFFTRDVDLGFIGLYFAAQSQISVQLIFKVFNMSQCAYKSI